ncbi:hypothetical protein [Olleya sp. YS]|uniref:hypothetical protein n=1 Tax=Olleya sp. YS TaxID=3028318 RepID=UPI0024343354|nr:hypothetical protein [Olleya sp. YS]WGD33822.1 hypothetical protein Ollyesu_08515 [Olleya sp. YS]
MKKTLLALSIIAITFTSCKTEIDPFLVQNQNIGLLTDSTEVKDLKIIFAKDSIISPIAGDEFTGTLNTINIYEKGGKHLLSLTPNQALDSTATISSIKIKDPRYKTENGISNTSTFGDIKSKYTITRIQNSFRSISVFVKDSDIFFLIDKNELPAEFRFDITKTIEEANIPDTAKIKHFMVGW